MGVIEYGSAPQPKLPEEGYHLGEDLADQAITMVLDAHVNAPERAQRRPYQRRPR